MRPIEKAPPLPSESLRLRRFGQPDPDGRRTYVFFDVFDELIFHAKYRAGVDSAALLVGGAYMGPAGPFVEIRGFVEATYLRTLDGWMRLLRDRYREIWRSVRAGDPTQSIVGWSHGSPGSGAVMSAELLRVHLSFFNLPHQVFVSVDSASEEIALFRRQPEGPMANVGFNAIARIEKARHPDPGVVELAEPAVCEGDPVGDRDPSSDESGESGVAEPDPKVDAAEAGVDAAEAVAIAGREGGFESIDGQKLAKLVDDSATLTQRRKAIDDEIFDAFEAIEAADPLRSARDVDIEEHVVTDEAWLSWSATDAPRVSEYDTTAPVERDVSDIKARYEELKRKRRLEEQSQAQSEPNRNEE